MKLIGGVVAQWSARRTSNATMNNANGLLGRRFETGSRCSLSPWERDLTNFPTPLDESLNRGLGRERMHTILHALKIPSYPSEEYATMWPVEMDDSNSHRTHPVRQNNRLID